MIDAPTGQLMSAYKLMKDGHLPVPGGAQEQSRAFLRLVRVIDAERGAIEEEREAERRRRSNR